MTVKQRYPILHRWLQRGIELTRFFFALVASSFVVLAAGCGQSGPLYLPGNPSQMQSPTTAAPDADEEKENKEDDGENPQG